MCGQFDQSRKYVISHNSTLLSDNKYTHFMSLFSLWCVWVFYNKKYKAFIYLCSSMCMYLCEYATCMWVWVETRKGCWNPVTGVTGNCAVCVDPGGWTWVFWKSLQLSFWLWTQGDLPLHPPTVLLFPRWQTVPSHWGQEKHFLSYAVSCWQTGHRKKVNLTAKTF